MSEKPKSFSVAPDEKATPVMVYTMSRIAWGSVVTKELVRVNTYIRTLNPDYVSLHDARAIMIGGAGASSPIAFPELHFRMPDVIAFHLLPPTQEPVDYDPAEANRKMEPITALVGPFRVEANARMSTVGTLAKFLEISSETFMSLYDAAISCPITPSLGIIRTPLIMIRRDVTAYATRG